MLTVIPLKTLVYVPFIRDRNVYILMYFVDDDDDDHYDDDDDDDHHDDDDGHHDDHHDDDDDHGDDEDDHHYDVVALGRRLTAMRKAVDAERSRVPVFLLIRLVNRWLMKADGCGANDDSISP